ncbi:hypothetical protein SGRIM128S_02633 [Streptomyces griseomycini]
MAVHRLTHRIGVSRARRLTLCMSGAGVLESYQALDLGVVDEITDTPDDRAADPAALDTAVAAAVEELAAPAVLANRRMLGLAEEPPSVLRAYLAEFALHQGLRLYAPDVLAKTTKFSGTS